MTLKKVGLLANLLLIFACCCEGGGEGHEETNNDHGSDDHGSDEGNTDHESPPLSKVPSNKMFKIYEFDVDMKSNPEHSNFKESYVNITNKNSTLNLTSFSYCFRFEFFSLNYQCLFYEGKPNVKVNFPEPQKDYGFIYFLGHAFIFNLPSGLHLYPKAWYHMCVSHELKSNQKMIKAYFNGHKVLDVARATTKTSVKFHERWTIGFCKYYEWEGHTVLSPLTTVLRGAISDFNLWSKTLNDNEMISFTRTCTRPGVDPVSASDLIEWDALNVAENGTAATLHELSWVCQKRSVSTVIFEPNTVFEDVMTWCNQLGGIVPYPTSQNKTIGLSKILTRAIDKKYSCEHFWMPIIQKLKPAAVETSKEDTNDHGSGGHKRKRGATVSDQSSEYSDPTTNENSFIWTDYFGSKDATEISVDWDVGQPDGLEYQPCVTLNIHTQKFHDQSCEEPTFCGVCQFQEPVHYYLRGIKKTFPWDKQFVFVPHGVLLGLDSIEFTGYHDQVIKLKGATHPSNGHSSEDGEDNKHSNGNSDGPSEDHQRRRRSPEAVGDTESTAHNNPVDTWEITDIEKGVVGKLKMPLGVKISPSGKKTWIPVTNGVELTKLEKELKLTKVSLSKIVHVNISCFDYYYRAVILYLNSLYFVRSVRPQI